MPHAKLKTPDKELEAGRPWWEVEGFDDLEEHTQRGFRDEAREFDSFNEEDLDKAFDIARSNIAQCKANAKAAVAEYQVLRRFYEAARRRLRRAPNRNGEPAARAIAAGSRHRADSTA